MKLSEIVRVTGGRLEDSLETDAELTSVVVDSRTAAAGSLFAALPGATRDGHDFIRDAVSRGATAVLCTRPPRRRASVIVVPDVERALVSLAAYNRDVVDPIVIGITGSLGKTGTKDFTAAVASRKYPTIASEMSFNNEIGVPLTLLRAGPGTEVLVAELGARAPGQIAELCDYVRPQVGIVTNVGVTHIEKFGSQEAIAETKGELIAALPEGGTAILNADDERVMSMRGLTQTEVLTFGRGPDAEVRAAGVSVSAMGHARFRLMHKRERLEVEVPFYGGHHVSNAIAAAAAGIALGLTLEECRAGLESAQSSPWRMDVSRVGGVVFVNDAWNANPVSVASALETCHGLVPAGGRLIAVLGYMAELGELSEIEHERAGELAAKLCSRVIVVGTKAVGIAEGARRSGMNDVAQVEDADAALDELRDLREGDVVLVKASRVERLETFVDRIKAGVTSG